MPVRNILLSDLIVTLPGEHLSPLPDLAISGITQDSRQVMPGSLFVAVSGGSLDGHRFIPDAIHRGAVAVVGEQSPAAYSVPYIRTPDSRIALAYLSAAFYGYPARKLTVIGVTGTDGKTTTANILYQILRAAGLKAGMISTVNALIGDQVLDTGFHVTTPEAPQVQSYLAQMVAAGLSHVILEATSHGLAQERVTACEFDMGLVTNITHEHLDYHGSFDAYRAAKGRLFAGLSHSFAKIFAPPRAAVLNRDDASYEYLAGLSQVSRLSYGMHADADVSAEQVVSYTDGLSFMLSGHDLQGQAFSFPLSTRLVGDYNIYNCLAAASLARGVMLLDDEVVRRGVEALPGVPGRMEKIDLGQNFSVLVDFAHTPNALRSVLQSARQLTQGRVIAVFGSAGLRDREKRRMMAETSADLADLTVLTAEDPRTESLQDILAEMAVGVEAQGGIEGSTFWRLPNRGEALRFALNLARPGDLVIACGKGHEQSMCFGEIEYPWDERIAMRAALSEYLGIPGPEMPYLPAQD